MHQTSETVVESGKGAINTTIDTTSRLAHGAADKTSEVAHNVWDGTKNVAAAGAEKTEHAWEGKIQWKFDPTKYNVQRDFQTHFIQFQFRILYLYKYAFI